MGTSRKKKCRHAKAWHIPVRLVTGAFILNSGLSKRGADEETAGQLHGFASGAYPVLARMDSRQFASVLSKTEIGLGVALLTPVVPAAAAGAALTAFSAGLLGLYARTPGMRQEHSIRPTEQGLSLSKDVWMLGIGTALVLDRVLDQKR